MHCAVVQICLKAAPHCAAPLACKVLVTSCREVALAASKMFLTCHMFCVLACKAWVSTEYLSQDVVGACPCGLFVSVSGRENGAALHH